MGHSSIKKGFVRWSMLVAVAWFSACGSCDADAITVEDATGRSVVISDASRIVSVGGAVTEILYALGLEQRVIAVDTTSLYPPRALAEKPNVGYMRQLSPEGVLALGPSLILAAEGSGPGPRDGRAARDVAFALYPSLHPSHGEFMPSERTAESCRQ